VIVVHHLEHSRSQRVLWLLEELDLPYEVVRYERDPATALAPRALEEVHPLGKSPVIVDGDQTIAESANILEYLVETYGGGRFVPAPGTPAYRRYRYFMHYAEGSLAPFLVLDLICGRIRTAPVPFFIKPVSRKIAGMLGAQYVNPNLARHIAFLDAHLAKHPYFAGDELTCADIQMSYAVETIVARVRAVEVPARLYDYVQRIQARPAYQRALSRGGHGPLVE
jgi:glutathione S-transferase